MRPGRLIRSAIVLKPSTLLSLHRALVQRKYRRLFSSNGPTKPGPKGPSQEVIAAVVSGIRLGLCQERARGARCCTRDEGGPFGAGLQEQASNSRELLPSNGGGGERSRKRRDSRVMCGVERRAQANHCRCRAGQRSANNQSRPWSDTHSGFLMHVVDTSRDDTAAGCGPRSRHDSGRDLPDKVGKAEDTDRRGVSDPAGGLGTCSRSTSGVAHAPSPNSGTTARA
jgi:hypothetical protein